MTIVGLYSDSDTIGGAERSLINLAAAYNGFSTLIVCGTNPRLLEQVARIDGVHTRLIEARASFVSSVIDHRQAFRALGLDLVQVTLANPFASRAALVASVLARIPTVAVEQLVMPSNRRRGAYLKRLLTSAQAATIAVGESSADDLHRFFGIPRHSIDVVHNGVPDPYMVDGVDRSPWRERETPVVGCAARLEDQKGIEFLVDAMARVPDARLVLVGDGERRGALEQQASRLGIAHRVEFAGWVDDAPARIAEFDLFALPSRNESFPLTIVEAMLAGTPVVATNVGSVAEAVVHGETGLLVPAGDVDALAQSIRRMLDDRALRDRLAAAARRRAEERFTDAAMAAGYDRVWTRVLTRKAR